ncbi:MAG: DUF1641 domain-containing protein [Saprospiraceae bacterium]|nr:DUF1641 domain-containing protein [Lewinella sp.]
MEHNGKGNSASWLETEAGKQVQARLTESRTLQALDHLLQRLDTLEKAVDRLGDAMHQGPGMIAMVGDMADEAYRQADARGVSIDERLRVALALAERLTEPEMVAKLDGLLKMADQAPGLMAMAADMADEAYRKADADGVSIDQRLQVALQMAEKLTAPEMAEKLDGLLKMADQAPGLMAMAADMADEAYRKADVRGVSIDQRLQVALQMAEKLTAPEMAEKMDSLLQLADQAPGMIAMAVDWLDESFKAANESGFDPKVLSHVAGAANTALTRAKAEHPTKSGGIFKMLGALKDEDRQKGLGFLLNFLKYFGQKL